MKNIFLVFLIAFIFDQASLSFALNCRGANCEFCPSDAWKCERCSSSFVLVESKCKTCSEVYSNCLDCEDGKCISCNTGFFINRMGGIGRNFQWNPWHGRYEYAYYIDWGYCCPENCDNCQNATCMACKPGFNYQSGLCQKGVCSDPNCAQCGAQGCYSCKSGFTLFQKKCLPGGCSTYFQIVMSVMLEGVLGVLQIIS